MSENIKPYASAAEQVEAMQHPLYKDVLLGDAYRAEVEARSAISNFGEITIRANRGTQSSVDGYKRAGRVVMSEHDMEGAHKIVKLTQEVDRLQEQVTQEERKEAIEEPFRRLHLSTERTARNEQAPEPFTSEAQVVASMRDPRYSTDSDFRAAVEARMKVTNLPGLTTRSGGGTSRESAQ